MTESNSDIDTKLPLDEGGAPHQTTDQGYQTMTTEQGVPVADDQSHLRAGDRGPMLMEDIHFRGKMFHFDHERIPERVVHARGYAAHGYFELTDSLADVTCAQVLTDVGKRTPVFTRFSTVAGSAGSPDLARDVRGFAVKFYTEEGNWDLVGNNMPVFFIQDAMKFPDLIHAAKPAPDRGFPQAQTAHDNFWDFITLSPESMHMVMWAMSDRAIPRSLRFMEGFGVHTFRLVTGEGKSTYVKFHWKPKAGMQSVVWNEALKINGADPDFHRRDLWNAIQMGDYPEWELGVQLFDDEFAEKFDFDILDPTKLIPEELVPVRIVGRMVLDRVVDNFFAETEQVAYCTQNVVPGIDFTNDPLLQGRNFSYMDTQTKRLGGPNFTHIPINRPKCPVNHFQQDGHMAMHNPKGRANYEPNSWGVEDGGPRENPHEGFKSFPEHISADKIRGRSKTFSDHYSQARQFYTSQTEIEQRHIQDAIIFELSKVNQEKIRSRMVAHLLNIDKAMAERVAGRLGMEMPEAIKPVVAPITDLPRSDALSILKSQKASFAGRKLGVLLGDGASAEVIGAIKTVCNAMHAQVAFITPRIGGVSLDDGVRQEGSEKIGGGPSVVFDAVAVLGSDETVAEMKQDGAARDFIADAFAHCKFIGYSRDSIPLLEKAGVLSELDKGCYEIETPDQVENFAAALSGLRFWERETKVNLY